MAGHYLVVSVLYVGILGLLWMGVLLGFRGVVDYLESVGSTLSYLISMVGYWIVFPLGTAPIVAWGLYRRFRMPLPATETSQSYKDS